MKSLFKKISLLTFLLVVAFSFCLTVSAQDIVANQTNNSTGRPPLEVIVGDVSFDNETREIKLNYSVVNNKITFADGLMFEMEIHRGDKLAETGVLFEPLEYVSTGVGKINKIAPGETVRGIAVYTPSAGIKSGNYFIRFSVGEPELNYVGLDYTKTPIFLTGQDFFLGNIISTFRTSKGDDFPLYGQKIMETETPSIIIPLIKNVALKSALNKGTKFFAEVKVFSFVDEEPVHEYPSRQLVVSIDKDGSAIIKYELAPWSGIKPSPYNVIMVIKDVNGRVVAGDIHARWWVDGFLARIFDIKTAVNFYKKDSPLDLVVSLISLNWANGQGAIVEAAFEKPDGQKIIFSKEVGILEKQDVDFGDFKMPEETMVKNISVVYKDKMTGEVFHNKTVELTQDKVYSPGGVNYNKRLVLYLGLLLILISTVLFTIFNKKKNIIILIIGIILLIIGIIGVYLFWGQLARAGYQSSTSNVWWSSSPSGNQGSCPKSKTVTASGSINCGTCRNGMTYSLVVGDSTCNWPDQGHVYDLQTFGPCSGSVSVDSTNNSSSYSATFSATKGCHCEASSATISGGPISCTSLINGACGSAASTPRLAAPTNNLCSDGAPTTVTGTGPWSWSCSGSNGGSSATCSAPVLAAPTNLTTTCNTDGTAVTVSWNPVSGATGYWPRVSYQNKYNDIVCNSGFTKWEYQCHKTNVTPTSFTYTTIPDKQYSTWVHSGINGVPDYTKEVRKDFTCALPIGRVSLNITGSTNCGGKSILSWNPITNSTHYQIFKRISATSEVQVGTTTDTTYEITAPYSDYFKVRACNSNTCGAFSDTASARPSMACPNISAVTSPNCGGKIRLSWNTSAWSNSIYLATNSYDIYKGETLIVAATTSTSYETVALSTDKFKIKAYYLYNGVTPGSIFSDLVSATPSAPCSNTFSVTCKATATNGSVATSTVTWSATPTGGTAPYTYSWIFNGSPSTDTLASVAKTYFTAGNYYATTTVKDNSLPQKSVVVPCSDSITGITVDEDGICTGCGSHRGVIIDPPLPPNPPFPPATTTTDGLVCARAKMDNPRASPVNINVNTTWTLYRSVSTSTATAVWRIEDANGTTYATSTVGDNILNKTFTTVGLKNVYGYFDDGVNSPGLECHATTSVVQEGGNNRER